MKLHVYLFGIFILGTLSISDNNVFAQTTYYVSVSGNDMATGTSSSTPWKTLAKINSTTFSNGDIILLKRGDTFQGKLILKNSGITIDAYGTGNNPIISGSEKIISTWTVNSGSIWETTISGTKPAVINNLFNGPHKLPISRHPNKNVNNGYLNFESHSGLTQITDNQLSGSPVWTGADMVVRSERFRLNRVTISSHSGTTLTFPAMATIENLRDGYGYFFVNELNAINSEGEWAYKASTGKVYLYSGTDPNTKSIYFPRADTTVYINSASNVIIKNIAIKYSGKFGVYLRNSPASLLDGITVTDCGGDGVFYNGCIAGTFQNSSISKVNGTGLLSNGSSSQIMIKNNTVFDIGDEAFGKSKTFIGIDCNSANSEVIGNTVYRTGYSGIISAGLNNLVKHNVVDSACLSLEDMGGIYTNYNVGANNGMVIEENIVTNSVGEMLGAPGVYSKANGIYVDNSSTGVTVKNNTVAFVKGTGIFANANKTGIEISDNTSFSSGYNEFSIYKPFVAPSYVIKNNLLISNSTDTSHYVINSDHTEEFTYAEMGMYAGNYVVSPFHEKVIVISYKDDNIQKTNRYTPYQWETAAPQISGTIAAPIIYPTGTVPADVIKFYYNKTTTPQSVTLPSGLYIDAKNQAYCGSTTIQPFQSLVLFKKGEGSCVSPSVCAVPTSISVDSLTGNTARMKWNGNTESINYDVRYRAEADSIWKYAHNIQDTTITLLGLQPQTYYESEMRSSCYGSESNWVVNPVFRTGQAIAKHVFVNADYTNCSPASAFALTHSDTDNKWTLQNSGGIGTMDKDLMRSSSVSENSPEITMTVPGVLDPCSTYDIYLYYLSPLSQPWKTQARLSTQPSLVTYDRNTAGAELLADNSGTNASNRLFRAKLGTVSGTDGFSVIIDDINYGSTSARTAFDGLGYLKVAEANPTPPDSLKSTVVSSSSISVSWHDLASNETAYVLERKLGSGSFSILATLPVNTTSYIDTVTVQGNYSYRVYAKNGECSSSYSNQLHIDNSEILKLQSPIKDIKKDPVSGFLKPVIIYPNPSSGMFSVTLPETKSILNLEIRDLNGKLLYSRRYKSEDKTATIDLSAQRPGYYVLQVADHTTKQQYKLIKQ